MSEKQRVQPARRNPSPRSRRRVDELQSGGDLASITAHAAVADPTTQALSPSAVLTLQRSIGNAAVGRLMNGRANEAGPGVVRRYTKTRSDDGGSMIGVPGACHCHIDIGSPHFKVGNDKASRINFGRDMSVARMQRAYETMTAKHKGKAGFDDCKEYFEEQGCEEPVGVSLVDSLKAMLLQWGGLSDTEISFYTDEHGARETVEVHGSLDDTITGAEDEIVLSDQIYADFLLDESPGGVDEEEMQAEANELYEQERRAAQKKKKK